MEDLNLRPMTLGEVLDRTFRLYKSNFWLFAGITALPFLLILLSQVIIAEVANPGGQGGQSSAISPGNLSGIFAGGLVWLFFYFVIIGYAHAATIFAVSDLYLSHPVTVRGSFAKVGAKVFRILLIFLLLFIAFFMGLFVIALVGGILVAIFRSPVILFAVLGLALLLALLIFCRVALAVPTAMLENMGAVRSLGRSVRLTEGFTIQVFLIYLLYFFLMYAAILLFQWPFVGMAIKAAASHQTLPLGVVILQNLGTFICQVLVGPIGTIAVSLMYYNLRVRKEAFDIQHLMGSLQPSSTAGTAATT